MNGIIFFNMGNKCTQRMLVAMYSLRKHYKGPCSLLYCGEQHKDFLSNVKNLAIDLIEIPYQNIQPLAIKSTLWRYTPYDVSLFLDADIIVVAPLTHVFPIIEQNKFAVYWFSNWITKGGMIEARIRAMSKVCPEYVQPAIDYKYAINTGVFGFTKDSPFLREWEELTMKTFKSGVNHVITDEIACQMLLHKYQHFLLGPEWGVSVKHGEEIKKPIMYHYHGRKHVENYPRAQIWKNEYWELLNETNWNILTESLGDHRLGAYLSRKKDLTIVTAVDERYLPMLKIHFPIWMKTKGLQEYPFIVFYDKAQLTYKDLSFLGNRTQIIPWDFESKTQREKMIASYIFGVAEHVKTKWWLKIDVDSVPCKQIPNGFIIDFPEVCWDEKYMVSSHKWHYTKPGVMLCNLEEYFDKISPETKRVFPLSEWEKMKIQKRYGHKRIQSFLHLEQTNFTKKVVKYLNGKFIVPSHDTIISYVLARYKIPHHRMQCKQWVNHI